MIRIDRVTGVGRAAGFAALLLVSVAASRPAFAQSVSEGDASSQDDGPVPVASPTDAGSVSGPAPEELDLVPGRPRVTPTRTDTPPEIDGRLDDPVWATAAHLTRFTQQAPIEGAPATEATDVYVAYDEDHLYLGFHAHYEDPSIMRANRVDRDRAPMDDLMTVYLDTFLDQQQGYDFDVNGYGVQGDGVITASGPGGAVPRADRSWDALFETGGRIVDDGFTAEMAIPFKSLRYPTPAEGEPHRWGLQIVREVKGKNQENQVWAPMSRDESSFFSQMGILEGMTELSTSRNLEIMPTVTAVQFGSIDPVQGAFTNRSVDPDAGVNVKYGVTSNLTADFTVNPDFSQIESDRPQIEENQRYPVFYQELRPFFVEGAEIFDIRAPVTIAHTRTIVDPDYGAKLTGKIGNLSLGVLTANDQAPGNLDDPDDPAFGETAQTFIARAQYQLWPESNVGLIATDREFLDGHSRVLGADGNFRITPTMSGDFRLVGSAYLEPGAAEERGGHMFATRLSRSGRHVNWSVFAHETSPEFDTDVGFIRRTDQRTVSGNLGYTFRPESWIIDWGPRVSYGRTYDFDDVLQDENLGLQLDLSFARNISLTANVDRDMERFRGADFEKTRFSFQSRFNTSNRYSFGGGFGFGDQVYYSADPFLGDSFSFGLNATVRPFSRLQTGVFVNSSRLTDPRNGDEEVVDVKVFRSNTNLQITDRLAMRNILEYDTQDETIGFNVLFNYRVNAGTVLYVGYDDRYQQADLIEGDRDGDGIDDQIFYSDGFKRTNRALFVKFQYLMRY